MAQAACPLCTGVGGTLVFQARRFRLIRAEEAGFPAFYRLVWTDHVAEFSDLDEADRSLCMAAINVVERALREHLQPTKINLATLGNVVPHLHWHVIARFDWDTHFPGPVWAAPLRELELSRLQEVIVCLAAAEQTMALRLATMGKQG